MQEEKNRFWNTSIISVQELPSSQDYTEGQKKGWMKDDMNIS